MKPNPIFQFIKTHLSPAERAYFTEKERKKKPGDAQSLSLRPARLASSPAHPKRAKKAHYFFRALPLEAEFTFELTEEKRYTLLEQHLSIDEEYDDRKPYVSAYHYTATLGDSKGQQVILHCHFDQEGLHHLTRLEQISPKPKKNLPEDKSKLNALDESKLKNYAELQILGIMQNLREKRTAHCDTLDEQIKLEEKRLVEFSKDFPAKLKMHFAKVQEILQLLHTLNLLSNNSFRSLYKAYQKIAANHPGKEPEALPLAVAEEEEVESPEALPALEPEIKQGRVSEPVSVPARALRLIEINAQLTALEAKADYSLETNLLEEKIALLPDDDFEGLISATMRLNQAHALARCALLNKALEGDIQAAQELIKNNHFISSSDFFALIHNNQFAAFKVLYAYSPISLNFSILCKTKPSVSPLEEAPPFISDSEGNGFLSPLQAAYFNNNLEFFVYLLVHCKVNPEMLMLGGGTLMHRVAHDGAILFAQALLTAGAQINSSAQKPKESISLLGATDAIEKNNSAPVPGGLLSKFPIYQNPHTSHLANYKLNPINEAIRSGQTAMFHWLQQQGVAVSDDQLYWATTGIYWGRKQKPLVPEIILALLEKGKSIDEKSIGAHSLYFNCDNQCMDAVQTLLQGFGVNPNAIRGTIGRQSAKTGHTTLSITTLTRAWLSDPTITLYLLNQDYVPLTRETLTQSIQECPSLLGSLPPTSWKKANTLVQAMQTNLKKLTHLEEAKVALKEKKYELCLNACKQAQECKFTLSAAPAKGFFQHNEQLFTLRFKAYYGKKAYKEAQICLEELCQSLWEKWKEALDPKLKAALKEKIIKNYKIGEMIEKLDSRFPLASRTRAAFKQVNTAIDSKAIAPKKKASGASTPALLRAMQAGGGNASSSEALPKTGGLAQAAVAQYPSAPLASASAAASAGAASPSSPAPPSVLPAAAASAKIE